jgi:hypothetical protein
MKLMASIDGTSCRNVWPRSCRARPTFIPSSSAARNAPRKTAVPGRAKKLRSMEAGSGVGTGVTGGVRMTASWSHGVGKVRNGIFRYLLNSGSAHRKMKTEARAKGDQPLRIVPTPWSRSSIVRSPSPSSIRCLGFQNRRKATITSSEKMAATMSTRPGSCCW